MAGFRDAYYIKALKSQVTIIKEFKNAFKDLDCTYNSINANTPANI